MLRFLLKRTLSALLVLWLVMSGVFFLVHVVGDPARATLGEKAGAAQLAAFRTKHGLDHPLGERYVTSATSPASTSAPRSRTTSRWRACSSTACRAQPCSAPWPSSSSC